MAKCNIHFHHLPQLTHFLLLILIIILSQTKFLEAITMGYNSSYFQPQCIEAERKALLQFKGNLTDPFHRLSSWVGEGCCEWVGVGCSNRSGRVVKLDLGTDFYNYSSMLGGKLSPSLLDLNHLNYLNLSGNSLEGVLPNFIGSLKSLYILDVSNNNLSGKIFDNWDTLGNLKLLDLSKNKLSGKIPSSMWSLNSIDFLDLSYNNLTGFAGINKGGNKIMEKLVHLDLSTNKISGIIPMSICSTPRLGWLDLSDNNFHGGLPLSLRNCSRLWGLNLGGNAFSGIIPTWFGKSYPIICILGLRMNELTGEIPQELCHFPYLHTLDLSHNSLSGTIPACIGNLSGLVISHKHDYAAAMRQDVMNLFMKGRLLEFVRILCLVNIIDLSNNNLTGEIPEEITNLVNFGTLNFSRNQLSGKIPKKIGTLKRLETLDLSCNHLSGPIPVSMTSLTSLSALDLSFNNLSGKIPSSTQFSTFHSSMYEGNPGLCGPPLQNSCYAPEYDYEDEDMNENEDEDEVDKFWFSVSLVLGFIMGLWGLFVSLAIMRSWRITCFEYFDGLIDKLFVFIEMKIACII